MKVSDIVSKEVAETSAGLFLHDAANNTSLLYDELLKRLGSRKLAFRAIIYSDRPVEIWESLLVSLLLDRPVTILDGDLSEEEVASLGFGIAELTESERIENPLPPSDWATILDRIEKARKWRAALYTSGTTGKPRCVEHGIDTLIRMVRRSEKHHNAVWGFAYNPTHIAGLQVFFQALFNGNAMINLFNMPRLEILGLLKHFAVTHISATPTYYRLLLPVESAIPSVRQVTFGGEKLDESLKTEMAVLFPNARFLNIYASTEAGTLFAARGEVFEVRPEVADNIKVADGELLLHRKLLGNSSELAVEDDWYHTGDLVEVVSESPLSFRFISRRSDIINVAGYRVDPKEVEAVLCSHDVIVAARVYGRPNPLTGNLLCCEVLSSNAGLTEKELRRFLATKLQSYKVPRMFDFVEKIDQTRTGKIKRNS